MDFKKFVALTIYEFTATGIIYVLVIFILRFIRFCTARVSTVIWQTISALSLFSLAIGLSQTQL